MFEANHSLNTSKISRKDGLHCSLFPVTNLYLSIGSQELGPFLCVSAEEVDNFGF